MRLFVLALVLLSTACGGSAAAPDAGIDAASTERDAHVVDAHVVDAHVVDASDVGLDASECLDRPQGAYECTGPNSGSGRECCGGRWRYFADGPCAPRFRDAGVPLCDVNPYFAGCPCLVEDELGCDEYRRTRCVSGVWTEVAGIGCCSP
jgi:hypothetical protein